MSTFLPHSDLTPQSRIHERLNADLPAFHHLLSTSKSVQHRLQTLTDNVDTLSDAVSHPEVLDSVILVDHD